MNDKKAIKEYFTEDEIKSIEPITEIGDHYYKVNFVNGEPAEVFVENNMVLILPK